MTARLPTLLVAIAIVLHACSGASPDGRTQPNGKLVMALTANVDGTTYRLRNAQFDITGPIFQNLSSESNANEPTVEISLVPGTYQVLLRNNWVMERVAPTGLEPDEIVPAVLLSANPRSVSVAAGQVTEVLFRFQVGDDVFVSMASGTLQIAIEVSTDAEPTSEWVQAAYIKASNGGQSDRFGSSVAISGDGGAFIVSGPQERGSSSGVLNGQPDPTDHAIEGGGAVYAFTRVGNVLDQTAYIKAFRVNPADSFGWTVALSGDGNTLLAASLWESSAASGIHPASEVGTDSAAPDAGAVYVFTRSYDAWSALAYVKADVSHPGDGFGWALAVSSDASTLAIAQSGQDPMNQPPTVSSSRVCMFRRANDSWTQDGCVQDPDTGFAFGQTIDLSDDGNTLAVSAAGGQAYDSGGNPLPATLESAGAAYVFDRSASGQWSQSARVGPSSAGEPFGYAVTLSGDGNTLGVSAGGQDGSMPGDPGQGIAASETGAVYVFSRNGTIWSPSTYLKASNAEPDDAFGAALSLSTDGSTLAVGAPGEDSAASKVDDGNGRADNSVMNSGAVYLFTRTNDAWSERNYIKTRSAIDDQFGSALALSGDGSSLLVGTPSEASAAKGINNLSPGPEDQSAPSAGAAYLFRKR